MKVINTQQLKTCTKLTVVVDSQQVYISMRLSGAINKSKAWDALQSAGWREQDVYAALAAYNERQAGVDAYLKSQNEEVEQVEEAQPEYQLTQEAMDLLDANGDITLEYDGSGDLCPVKVVETDQPFEEYRQERLDTIVYDGEAENYEEAENYFDQEMGFTDAYHLAHACKSGQTWPLDLGLVEKVEAQPENDLDDAVKAIAAHIELTDPKHMKHLALAAFSRILRKSRITISPDVVNRALGQLVNQGLLKQGWEVIDDSGNIDEYDPEIDQGGEKLPYWYVEQPTPEAPTFFDKETLEKIEGMPKWGDLYIESADRKVERKAFEVFGAAQFGAVETVTSMIKEASSAEAIANSLIARSPRMGRESDEVERALNLNLLNKVQKVVDFAKGLEDSEQPTPAQDVEKAVREAVETALPAVCGDDQIERIMHQVMHAKLSLTGMTLSALHRPALAAGIATRDALLQKPATPVVDRVMHAIKTKRFKYKLSPTLDAALTNLVMGCNDLDEIIKCNGFDSGSQEHVAIMDCIAHGLVEKQRHQPMQQKPVNWKLKLNAEWEYIETNNLDTPTLDLGAGIKLVINFAMDPIADTGDHESSAYVDMHTSNGNTDTLQFIVAKHVMRVLGGQPFFETIGKDCDEAAMDAVNATIQDLIDDDFSEILQIAEVQS